MLGLIRNVGRVRRVCGERLYEGCVDDVGVLM